MSPNFRMRCVVINSLGGMKFDRTLRTMDEGLSNRFRSEIRLL
jgi:hypothetical protein